MSMQETIYYIYHVPGVKIGCTKRLKRRMQQQGFISFEVLETHTDIFEAGRREKELQKEYGYKVDKHFYYIQHAEEILNKKSEIMKGKTFSEEVKKKISVAGKGNQNMKGKTFSEEAKKKISEVGKGRIRSPETRLRMSEARKKDWERRRLGL